MDAFEVQPDNVTTTYAKPQIELCGHQQHPLKEYAKNDDDDVKCYKKNGMCKDLKELNLEPECSTLKDLTDGLHQIFESDHVDVDEVQAFMSSYKSNPAEWLKYAKFDRYRYTRNLVDAGNGKFNLMVLCWGEGQGSSIHDHADSHCFMKILAGSLSEIRYKWPDSKSDDCAIRPLDEIDRISLNTDAVCYINDSIGLHRVENLSYSDAAVSLHLYSPPFEECHVFDLRTGRSTKSQVTFWSKFGERKRKSRAKTQSGQSGTESED